MKYSFVWKVLASLKWARSWIPFVVNLSFSSALLTQCSDLPKDNSESPNVAFTWIQIVLHRFNREPPQRDLLKLNKIVFSIHKVNCLCFTDLFIFRVNVNARSRKSEIWYLQCFVFVYKNVSSRQIPVCYLQVLQMIHASRNLNCKIVQFIVINNILDVWVQHRREFWIRWHGQICVHSCGCE